MDSNKPLLDDSTKIARKIYYIILLSVAAFVAAVVLFIL